MTYLYRRGPGSKRRVMHITSFNHMTGEPTFLPLCGTSGPYNTAINVRLGLPVCKRCAVLWEISR